GIRDRNVTGVQTCALPIFALRLHAVTVVENLRGLAAQNLLDLGRLPNVEGAFGLVLKSLVRYLAGQIRRKAVRVLRRVKSAPGRSEERRVGKEGSCGGWAQ